MVKKNDKYNSRFGSSLIDGMANPDGHGLSIQFYHIGTKQRAEFAAFITEFSDSYASNWNQQQVFGRMDPIMNIVGTGRTISLGFSIPSYSMPNAQSNIAEVNKLVQFLYPTYRNTSGHSTIQGNPLVKVQFQNLIASGKNTAYNVTSFDLDSAKNGLVVAITSLSSTPDFEQGSFGMNGMQFPKLWNISMSMQVLHNHSLDPKENRGIGFPYAASAQAALNPQNPPEKEPAVQQPEAASAPKVNGQEVPTAPKDQAPAATKAGASATNQASENKVGTPAGVALKGIDGNPYNSPTVAVGDISEEVAHQSVSTSEALGKKKKIPFKSFFPEKESSASTETQKVIKGKTKDQYGNDVDADYYEGVINSGG